MDLDKPLDEGVRGILRSLAEALFPLADWIKQKKYVPSNPSALPWREPGRVLSVADLSVIEFFEALLRETAGDEVIAARWKVLHDNPLTRSPYDDPQQWRGQRGLSATAAYGVEASDNAPVSRRQFYDQCWSPLRQVVVAVQPQTPEAWQKLAQDLLTDSCAQWPATLPIASSTFITQFARDVLYGMMGMRNPAPPPWKFALLVELGEHRRQGNRYLPSAVNAAVEAFKALI